MASQDLETAINLVDFGLLRIGVATPEMRVADVDFNVAEIRKIARRSQRAACPHHPASLPTIHLAPPSPL